MLKAGDVTAHVRELAGLGAPARGHGDPLSEQADLDAGEGVALGEHLLGQRLLADLEGPEPHGLGRDLAPGTLDRGDDAHVLLADPGGEGDLLEQVPEAAGLEDDADDVRVIGLVVVDELRGEHLLGPRLEGLELGEARAGGVELGADLEQLGPLGVEVGLDRGHPMLERGDRRAQLREPTGRRVDRCRPGSRPGSARR